MSEFMPPARNGTEQRLDAMLARLDRIAELLTPAPAAPEPQDGETIELREPATEPARPKRAKP